MVPYAANVALGANSTAILATCPKEHFVRGWALGCWYRSRRYRFICYGSQGHQCSDCYWWFPGGKCELCP